MRRGVHTAGAMSDFVTEFKSLKRPREGRLLFGVCRALADRFGTEVVAIRIGVVLAAAVIDYVPLAYIVGVLFIPSVEKSALGRLRTRGRIRQLLMFGLLAGVSDVVIDDSLPSSRVFSLFLVLAGMALMNLRSRSLRNSPNSTSAETSAATGGWAVESDVLPPRWGLAGESINPEMWSGIPGVDGSSTTSRSRWQSQFGNLALVALVSVLAIGLWSNTSDHSPLRRAALLERLAAGPVKISNPADLAELKSTPLGDGSFTIDLSEFRDSRESSGPLDVEMGSGRLDIVVRPGTQLTGSIKAGEGLGNVVVRTPDSTTGPGPLVINVSDQISAASPVGRQPDVSLRMIVSVSVANGLVCIREIDHAAHCGGLKK